MRVPMNHQKHFGLVLVSILVTLLSGIPSSTALPPSKNSTLSKSVTPEIIDGLAQEIERAMTELTIPRAPKPYFIGYKLTEVEVNDVHASLGATTASKRRHFVHLEAHVHVGSYRFDNSNFVVAGAEQLDGVASVQLPLEASPRIVRRAAWLVTDTAYKEALGQITAKADARQVGRGRPDLASNTRHPAVVQDKPVLVPKLEEHKALEARATSISNTLRKDTHLRDSRVAFTSFLERRWYLNSEGTSAHDTRRVTGVILVATGQAPDGQELALYYSRYGQTGSDLPSDRELSNQARKLAQGIRSLQSAKVMEPYSGPVLLEGLGAAGIVRYTLANHLGGTPVPENLDQERAKYFGGALTDRVGFQQVSRLLSFFDDPTTHQVHGRHLIGGYQFDDEGVPAQRVQIIKNGKLQTLLMSRIPGRTIQKSNGHARRSAPGGSYHGSATNLLVHSKRGLGKRALERKLLAEARKQGLSYGIIISQLDDAAVTAAPELSQRELVALLRLSDPTAPPPIALAYKLHPNGKRELIRGAQLSSVAVDAWRRVIATGRKRTVFNYLASGELDLSHRINGVAQGFVPSGGVESAIVTPNLLFESLNIIKNNTGKRPLPAVPRPSP